MGSSTMIMSLQNKCMHDCKNKVERQYFLFSKQLEPGNCNLNANSPPITLTYFYTVT